MVRGGSKKGQVTIFIIIALIVLVFGIGIYFLYPTIVTTTSPLEENPRAYIQNCVQEDLENNVETIALQGGSMEPGFFYSFKGVPVEYWCYTNLYYELCTVQQPLIIPRIENEIKLSIEDKMKSCFDSMVEDYRKKGYGVTLAGEGEISVDLLPKNVIVSIDNFLTLTKESSETYDGFNVFLNNNIYESASIAKSILKWEYTFGQIDSSMYNSILDNFIVKEENNQPDGTKIYVIKEVGTETLFQFASRSKVMPLGFPTLENPGEQ